MKNTKPIRKVLSLVLTLVMVFGSFGGTGIFAATENKVNTNGAVSWETVENSLYPKQFAAENLAPVVEETTEYKDTDVVRVSIVLKAESTIKKFATENIAKNAKAIKYRANLEKQQAKLAEKISKTALNGKALDVAANLTLAANIISAYVEYGQIEKIAAVSGVKEVFIENCYEAQKVEESDAPNMGPSSGMIGSGTVWAEGYTGAGSKVAIVDTGVDDDHQSFAAAGYEYAMKQNAEAAGMSLEDYKASVGVLTAEDVAAVWDQLNASAFAADAEGAYLTSKIPFAVNYVDKNLVINHDHDGQGEHGSHVTGIAAGNRYVANGDKFEEALNYVGTQGVAPDAQIVTMKVFGARGGAYDADYMLAIEDAIILGCDSVNLSLGSAAPGRESAGKYEEIMNNITESGTVVVMSGGNSGSWFENTYYGYLYADDVATHTGGSPGSFTNTFTVASIDNDGVTGQPLKFGDMNVFYTETSGYSNKPIVATLLGENDYVIFPTTNTGADGAGNNMIAPYADVVKGKVVMVYRGTSSFYQKLNAAGEAGASACIVINNQPGTINMDLTGGTYAIPCVSITQADGAAIWEMSEGTEEYRTGKLVVTNTTSSASNNSEYYTMSDFSSWGVPGSLELKPEITAPGGSIYSVNGAIAGGKAYELMSGTSMAAPQTTGMVALFGQYLRENGLEDLGYSARQLAISLLMSTAKPVLEADTEYYYSVLKQGSGLAQIDKAVSAKTFLMMADNATKSAADGKIKVELGDDPERKGVYTFGFSINNMESKEKYFDLYADMFTQIVFDEIGAPMLYTGTTPLDFTAEWKVDGTPVVPNGDYAHYDFDGDGDVDTDDGQALLDLATTVRESIFNADYADFDADGDIDTYDAYLFFKTISEAAVIVPADGKIDVECTITLEDIDDYDFAGAFVEGFVYAEELSTEEGVEGDLHSIPVLGYYGSWTEPGMFDKGSYNDYKSGAEKRIPYLYGVTRTKDENRLTVVYPGVPEMIFGGNPVIADKKYMPERDALSSENGTKIGSITYTLIRNAEAGKMEVVDEDGTVYNKKNVTSPAALNSSYYYTNKSAWYNTTTNVAYDWEFKGGVENKKAAVALTLAPEYYTLGGQSVDWDSLADGATKAFNFTVDNTAPEIVGMNLSTDLMSGEKSIKITVKDNQYVAALVVMDNAGNVIGKFGSDANAKAGDEVAYDVDLGTLNKIVVQVYDYAYNLTTTKVTVGGSSEPIPVTGVTVTPEAVTLLKGETANFKATIEPLDADNTDVIWTSSDEKVATVNKAGVVTAVGVGVATIKATSAENEELFDTAEVTVESLKITVRGGLQDAEGTPELFSWNLEKDATWTAGPELPAYISSMTTSPNADYAFLMSDDGYLYKFDPETGEQISKSEASVEDGFGIEPSDITGSYIGSLLFNTDVNWGVYAGFFLYDTGNNDFGYGFDLADYLKQYTGASNFIALSYVGIEMCDEEDAYFPYNDVYYALDDAGYIWIMHPYLAVNETTGQVSWSASFGIVPSNFQKAFNGYCSMAFIEGTDNGVLSYFNGGTNELYWITYDEEAGFVFKYAGNVGDDVWPAAILSVEENEDIDLGTRERTFAFETVATINEVPEGVTYVQKADGGLNAVTAAPVAAEKLVKGGDAEINGSSAEVTAVVSLKATDAEGNDIDSTNGLLTATWDPEALELVDVEVFADYESVKIEEGKAIIGYVALDGIEAGEDVAQLTFKFKDHKAVVTVEQSEASDDDEAAYTETICLFEHAFTEVRDAKDATCTEDGYTGDTYCLDCDELLEEGEVIPALGHDWSEWTETKAPTCTEEGEETRECSVCHEKETRKVAAKGHDFDRSQEGAKYVWNEDKTECKVVFTCKNCGEEEEHDCTVEEEVVKEATETEPGLKKITATYTDEQGNVYTTTVEVVIPVKTSPETGLIISGIGVVGALGAAAYVFGRKRKEDEE